MAGRSNQGPRVEVWMFVKDGNKLRRRRRDKRLSQVQLAALAGCTQQYVSLIEQGLDNDISEKIAEKISRYLDVSLEDYFEERRVSRTPDVATVTRAGRKTAGAR